MNPSEGLTNRQLTKLFGFSSPGAVSNASAQGLDYFQQWSKRYDKNRKPWTFEGTGKSRRFYRLD